MAKDRYTSEELDILEELWPTCKPEKIGPFEHSVKHTRQCDVCGGRLTDSDRFCPLCGSKCLDMDDPIFDDRRRGEMTRTLEKREAWYKLDSAWENLIDATLTLEDAVEKHWWLDDEVRTAYNLASNAKYLVLKHMDKIKKELDHE